MTYTLPKGEDMSEPKIEVITIHPDLAREMLEKNTGNFRRMDKLRVDRYAIDIRSGKWDLNGETIKFNGNVLVDGQHRLAAIVKAGVAVKMIVVRGIHSAANIDLGRARKVSDWLAHLGIKNAIVAAAIARLCLIYNQELWNSLSVGVNKFSPQQVANFAAENDAKIQDAIALSRPASRIVQTTMLSAVMFYGCGPWMPSENLMCRWFCHALTTGESLDGNEPVFQLRNKFVDTAPIRRMNPYMSRMMLTLAWNKTVAGEKVKQLKLTMSGPTKQDPPNKIFVAECES